MECDQTEARKTTFNKHRKNGTLHAAPFDAAAGEVKKKSA